MMRYLILATVVLVLGCDNLHGQPRLLKKSWIKTSVEDLSGKILVTDSIYMRYTFRNSDVVFGFEPGWNETQMTWMLNGKRLKIGFDEWTIETLTDSSLTIMIPGFRRINFLSEELLRSKESNLQQVGEYDGRPVFKPTKLTIARYRGDHSLRNDIQKYDRSDHYNIRKAGTFLMTFIVTRDGKVDEPRVLQSVAEGFDKDVVAELLKTSKKWTPAIHNGEAIDVRMVFEIRFLDSISN